jgi:phosphopantothenoylcysteine decarboxylase / phosphopantothenate---cysteine ligase
LILATAYADAKIKKTDDGAAPELQLTQTPDILAGLARDRPRPGLVVVGFAAETGDESGSVMDHARAKLARKGCDLLVVNDVGGGKVFGETDNEAVVLGTDGDATPVPRGSKSALAHVIWDRVTTLLAER